MTARKLTPAQTAGLQYLATAGAEGLRPFAATTRVLIERGLAAPSARSTHGEITDAGRRRLDGMLVIDGRPLDLGA